MRAVDLAGVIVALDRFIGVVVELATGWCGSTESIAVAGLVGRLDEAIATRTQVPDARAINQAAPALKGHSFSRRRLITRLLGFEDTVATDGRTGVAQIDVAVAVAAKRFEIVSVQRNPCGSEWSLDEAVKVLSIALFCRPGRYSVTAVCSSAKGAFGGAEGSARSAVQTFGTHHLDPA
jgi:hypothetical protein